MKWPDARPWRVWGKINQIGPGEFLVTACAVGDPTASIEPFEFEQAMESSREDAMAKQNAMIGHMRARIEAAGHVVATLEVD